MIVHFKLKNGHDYAINTAHIAMISTTKRVPLNDTPVDQLQITLISGTKLHISDTTFKELFDLWVQTQQKPSDKS